MRLQCCTWATVYNVWLLIELTPDGVIFAFFSGDAVVCPVVLPSCLPCFLPCYLPCCLPYCLPCLQDTIPSDTSIIPMLLKANNKATGTPLTDL